MNRFLQTLYIVPFFLSCTNSQEDIPVKEEEQSAIGFNAKVQGSRAVADIDDVKTNGFSVWGGYESGTSPVFEGTEITLGSENSYTTDKYWTYNTYNFYAVYPKGTTATYNVANNTFTINNYNVKNTEDLLCASETHTYPKNGTTVNLNFKHLLTKVSVNLVKDATENSGDKIVVTDVSLNGMYMQGNYTLDNGTSPETGKWNGLANSSTMSSGTINQELTTSEIAVLTDCMMVPQTFSADHTVYLVVNYTFDQGNDGNNISTKTLIAPLPYGYVWGINTNIVYKATILVDHNIEFATPVVEEWGTEQAGGTIIIT